MRIRLLGGATLFVGLMFAAVHAISAPSLEAALEPPALEGPVGDVIHKLVLDAIPHEYEDTRKWGGTKRVWDGVKVELDGLKVKTKRRWKDARHGTWKRYRLRLINPEEEFQIRLENVRQTPSNQIAFDLIVMHMSVPLPGCRNSAGTSNLSASASMPMRWSGCSSVANWARNLDSIPTSRPK